MRSLQRWILIACVLMTICGSALLAGPPVRPPTGKDTQSSTRQTGRRRASGKAEKKATAIKALKTVVKNAEFKEMPFEDFIEWLERTTNTNIVVRWNVLEAAGVERDYPIILKRKNITIRDLLPLVFRQLTEDLRDVELAAKADGKTIVISTHKDVQAKLILKTYDIQDLLVVIPNFSGMDIENLGVCDECGRFRVRRRTVNRGGGGSGQARAPSNRDRNPSSSPHGKDVPENAQKLIDIITTQIRPLSWRVNGGRGTIVFFKGKLVIRNTYEVHEMIGGDV